MTDELKPPQLYLANLERFMATHTLRQIRLLSHCHQNRVANWRKKDAAFREREAELMALRAQLEKTSTPAEREAEVRFPRRFRVFMTMLRKFDDRMQAVAESGLSGWDEVQRGLREHEGFSEAYKLWNDEQEIRVEDKLRQKGLAGDASALRALQARRRGGGGGEEVDPGDEAADKFFEDMAKKGPPVIARERPDVDDDEARADA